DELTDAFTEQMRWLEEEGVDAILVETIFDTLNAKAAIEAHRRAANDLPLMLSMTVSDNSGRTLSGQTVETFCSTVAYAQPLSIGMNCGLGPEGMIPYVRRMQACLPHCYISCHPNAGLPNAMGEYDISPDEMAQQMRQLIEDDIAQIIGGCCGTTPEHIRALAALSQQVKRKKRNESQQTAENAGLCLTGLDRFVFTPSDFVVVGERCNVAGSRKFLRLINEKQYDDALSIARQQVEQGAMVIDLNMDDGLLDARTEVCNFLRLMASDPSIARVPVMIDSSDFRVIEEGLKCWQGKAIVNSISLKQGEEEFLRQARTVHRMGAAVVVMCFDEEGQATDYERRIRICQRAYDLLTKQVGMHPTDIIFDPNVLTIATGMAEHANYASDFIRATQWIHENLPGARVSGGLSNLSFAFRGNNPLREA
ncbi:MAG: homocysteine S-methyltransferase family protein, partial [Bacteroidaceae bacterium]|nr:homocysteine S-methyltransferase family protein [Bacteroidaceae bacterium]